MFFKEGYVSITFFIIETDLHITNSKRNTKIHFSIQNRIIIINKLNVEILITINLVNDDMLMYKLLDPNNYVLLYSCIKYFAKAFHM